MPKDITHWLLAEKTAGRLIGTDWGTAAAAHPNLLRIGAVFPDLPYYLTGTDELACRCREVGNAYHGAQGEDTYMLLRALFVSRDRDAALSPARLAFLVGVISHLQADMVFHPFVYYLTGHYFDPDPVRRTHAIRDHRRLEGLLDLYLCGGLSQARTFSAQTIWDGMECPGGEPFKWAAQDHRFPNLESALQKAARIYLAVQGHFIRPFTAWLVETLDPVLPNGKRELTALFYTESLEKYRPRLSGKLPFRNPVSGESHTATVDELLEQAVSGSVALCRRLDPVVASGDASIFTEEGPSLNFGLVRASVSQARYFADTPFFSRPK